MSVQPSTFAGVGYERTPDTLDDTSSSVAAVNLPIGQETSEEAPLPTQQGFADSAEITNFIQGTYGSSGGINQSPTQPSPSLDQSSGSSTGNVTGVGSLISAVTNPPPKDGAGETPQPTDTRPRGDTRSADQIVADNPTLANLGNQDHVMDNLKKQCGDWTDPRLTPDQRADAAYRASEVLNYIKSSSASDGSTRSSSVTDDGKIDGFTKDGDARHGTEAGALKDFGEQGYVALSSNHNLDQTSDTHVKKDGTTMSNAAWVGDNILKGFSAVSNIVSNIASVVGDLHIPIISTAAKGISIGAEGASQGAQIGSTALEGGDVKGSGEHAGVVMGETGFSQLTGIPGSGKAIVKGGEELTKEVAKKVGKGGLSDTASTILDGPSTSGTPEDTFSKVTDTIANI